MSPARTPRGVAERHGRFGRIPTPTPLQVGDINAYLVLPAQMGGPLTLIDTGVRTEAAFEALARGVAALGGALERIERILVTHAHMDHFGLAERLRALSGATVHASAPEAEFMRAPYSLSGDRDAVTLGWFRRWGVPDDVSAFDAGMRTLARELQGPTPVDGLLAEGDVVAAGDLRLHAIETPGHCPGHLVFYEPESHTLVAGDHLLPDISPVPLLELPKIEGAPRPKSLVRFLASLSKVESLRVDCVLPSHGDPYPDHRRVIAGYRLHHERRKLQFLRQLDKGPLTPFELATRLFAKYYRTQLFLVMSEVIGHLDVLVDEGSVAIELVDGVERARLRELPEA